MEVTLSVHSGHRSQELKGCFFHEHLYNQTFLHTMKLAPAGHWKEAALSHFNIVFTFEMWNQHPYIVNGKHKGNKLMLETNFLK